MIALRTVVVGFWPVSAEIGVIPVACDAGLCCQGIMSAICCQPPRADPKVQAEATVFTAFRDAGGILGRRR